MYNENFFIHFQIFFFIILFAENLLKVNFFWFRVCEITIEKNIRGNLQCSIANFLMYKLNENFIQVLCVVSISYDRRHMHHIFFLDGKAKEISFEIFVTIFFLVCWSKREKCRNIIFMISKECRTSFFHLIFVWKSVENLPNNTLKMNAGSWRTHFVCDGGPACSFHRNVMHFHFEKNHRNVKTYFNIF